MIVKYNEFKNVLENNDIILKEIANYDLLSLDEKDIINIANSLFKLFKVNFESNNYSVMREVSNYCRIVVAICIDKKFYIKAYCAETIIDIACFVFEQMYLYEDKVLCLREIIKSDDVAKELKKRALEEIMTPEPEVRNLVIEEVDKYSQMLKELSN